MEIINIQEEQNFELVLLTMNVQKNTLSVYY